MSFTSDVLTAVAEALAGPSGFVDTFGEVYAGEGVGTWRPNGAYQPTDATPIFLGDVPGSPHRLIALTAYTVDDDPSLSDSTLGVQVRTRGNVGSPRDVDELDDAVFDALHGARGLSHGNTRVVQILRRSGAPIGRDGNRRFERSSNYYATAHRPTPHRT